MEFYNNWDKQKNWNVNIAAIITSFCRFHQLEISRTTIYEKYSGKEKMANFKEVIHFCKDFSLNYIHLNIVRAHLDQEFFPAFVLMNGYRTQLLMYADEEKVYYLDALMGWQSEQKDRFIQNAMGNIVLVDPSSYVKEPDYQQKLEIEKEQDRIAARKWTPPQLNPLEVSDLVKKVKLIKRSSPNA